MTRLPILLTLFRLMAGIGFLPLVLCHAGNLLIVWLFIGFISDIVDGIIARRFRIDTLALRRLDSRADIVFYGCAIIAALVYASLPLDQVYPWLMAYFSLFLFRNFVDYLHYRASASYHMWSGKLWSIVLFVHMIMLFRGAQALPLLPFAFALYAINSIEGIVASLVLPEPYKDVPSLWHAIVLARVAYSSPLTRRLRR